MSLCSILLIIVSSAFSTEFELLDSPLGCLTDELYGGFTEEEYNNLVNTRKKVRESMNKHLDREKLVIFYIPVVFHNLYKTVDGTPINSYCDFGYDVLINDQDRCNTRILRSLEVLNAQYLPSGIQFELHDDYPEMLQDTDPGYDGFFEDATGANSPSPEAIKNHYNIPNVLNIYTHECLPSSTSSCQSGKNGFSPYPWDLDKNEPGVFIIHSHMPGSVDKGNPNISILAHEIGHSFSLLHINGIWFFGENNIPRELVNGSDCDIHGDLICDTPGSPGHELNSSWYIDSTKGECIYHGFGGGYNPLDSTLKIGGYNNISPTAVIYNYCEKWNFVNPYGLDHCESYTNYDNIGKTFGTRGLLEENQGCYHYDENDDIDLSEYSTECHINNYSYLPIGHNFMGPTILTQYCAQVGHLDYDNTKDGFTEEQFLNIRNSVELDYTICNDVNACNTGFSTRKGIANSLLLRSGESSCLYPCNKQESEDYYEEFYAGCLITDAEYQSDYSQYECSESPLALNQNIIPKFFGINRIFPNPFNPNTTIDYEIPENTVLKIVVYDIRGKQIRTLANEYHAAGYHSIIWNASSLASGIYFLKIYSEKFTSTQKLVLIK